MRIQVKQQHIDNGEREEPGKCPLALAARDDLEVFTPDAAEIVRVDCDIVEVYYTDSDGEFKEVYELDAAASKFVNDFDQGKTVRPFCTDIEYVGEFDAGADAHRTDFTD